MTADFKVITGDCFEVMRGMVERGERFDAVVTDPPYGVNLGKHAAANDARGLNLQMGGYSSYDDTHENLVSIVAPAVRLALSASKRGAVFCASTKAGVFPEPSAVGGVYLPSGCGRHAWGFQNLAHVLFYGSAPDLHLGARPSVLRSTATAEKSEHPCPKPVEWMVWLIELATRPGNLVLDPFCGSGTTGVACIRLGRRFIGIEKDEKYAAIARERLEAESRGLSLKASRAGQSSIFDVLKEGLNQT